MGCWSAPPLPSLHLSAYCSGHHATMGMMPQDVTDDERYRRLVQHMEPSGRLLRTWPLTGGVSAQVTALQIERSDGRLERVVVRRHGEADLIRNPHIARDEFRLLRVLSDAGVAVPTPLYFDEPGGLFPTPLLVVEYIEGSVDLSGAEPDGHISQLASELANIHSLDLSALDVAFLPPIERRYAGIPVEETESGRGLLDESPIQMALAPVWPPMQRNPSVLLHGDFWPGNALWRDGRLAGVIDWEDAAVGDPLADLANSRLEMLWAFGPDAMRQFTGEYLAIQETDIAQLPYWDLAVALLKARSMGGWGLDPEVERSMRVGLDRFVAQATTALAAQ
jgi:aminoglycoside phosphotransferase (APT) family kinase protein